MSGLLKRSLLSLAVSAGIAGIFSANAPADDGLYGDRHGRDYRHGDEDRRPRSDFKFDFDFTTGSAWIQREADNRPHFVERRVKVWIEPTFRTVSERVWVEPVYRCETERVWIAPAYKTIYEEVRIPERWEVRETIRYEQNHKVITRERILVAPACMKRVPRQVCISEGRWNLVEKKVCVSEGHWDVVEKRVCVTGGQWDYRTEHLELSRRVEATSAAGREILCQSNQ